MIVTCTYLSFNYYFFFSFHIVTVFLGDVKNSFLYMCCQLVIFPCAKEEKLCSITKRAYVFTSDSIKNRVKFSSLMTFGLLMLD